MYPIRDNGISPHLHSNPLDPCLCFPPFEMRLDDFLPFLAQKPCLSSRCNFNIFCLKPLPKMWAVMQYKAVKSSDRSWGSTTQIPLRGWENCCPCCWSSVLSRHLTVSFFSPVGLSWVRTHSGSPHEVDDRSGAKKVWRAHQGQFWN